MHQSQASEGVIMDVSSMFEYTRQSMILLNNVDESSRELQLTIRDQKQELHHLNQVVADIRVDLNLILAEVFVVLN